MDWKYKVAWNKNGQEKYVEIGARHNTWMNINKCSYIPLLITSDHQPKVQKCQLTNIWQPQDRKYWNPILDLRINHKPNFSVWVILYKKHIIWML